MPALNTISIQYLKGVGPARKKFFENLGVFTVEDLLFLFPRRYEDRRKMASISELKEGVWCTLVGNVCAKGGRRTFWNKKHMFELALSDEKARVCCVWFNQPYLENYFHVGDKVIVHGRVEVFNHKVQIVSPEYEIIKGDDEELNMARIVPVYPLTKGMTQRYLRKVMALALKEYADHLVDVLPVDVLSRQSLRPVTESIRDIHFPPDEKAQEEANRRISFDEFFMFQIAVMLRRRSLRAKKGIEHFIPETFFERFLRAFPFKLTESQQKALGEVAQDMRQKKPMLRLLQGDVGSGKTVVAFFGCLAAVTNGHQAAFMAPTEILAEQQYHALTLYCAQGFLGEIRTAFLNSGLKKKDKEALYNRIQAGEVDVLIGTHALLEQGVEFKKLSFVAIDEQHKFGVKQRALLSAKGDNPDVLVMTATPIPRSLCLTLYGDLDVSVIDEKPKGRGTIKTYHLISEQADAVYKRVAEWVKKGTQAYIVYPIIEESEKADLKAAVDMFERFKENDFKDFSVGLIHGRLPKGEAEKVMEKFKNHEINVLVTTTVLEVGIDVPNANVMVIEHAERFGLAQLHQLRGRIGRSEKNAICVLLGDPQTEDGKKRIEGLLRTTDGFKIAQEDLEIRGPGQYFGRHQHGLNELRVVDPLTQLDVLEAARKEAIFIVGRDPLLKDHGKIKDTLQQRYPEYLQRIQAG